MGSSRMLAQRLFEKICERLASRVGGLLTERLGEMSGDILGVRLDWNFAVLLGGR